MYEVVGVQSQTELDRKKAGMSLQGLNTARQIPDDIQTPQEPEEDSGNSHYNPFFHLPTWHLYNKLLLFPCNTIIHGYSRATVHLCVCIIHTL